MDREAALQLLKSGREGVTAWNSWRDAAAKGSAVGPIDFRSVDLRGADLSSANLQGVDFTGAQLTRANLSNATLTQALFVDADLALANLSASDLTGASFFRANLTLSDLSHAQLEAVLFAGTVLAGVRFAGTKGLDKCVHVAPSHIDHMTLQLNATLPPPFLRGAGLSNELIAQIPAIYGGAEFSSCFLSYSHHDKAFARWLHDELQRRGVRCWLDEKQLLAGDRIHEAVGEAIRTHDKLLLCCSSSSLSSSWVDDEIGAATERERREGRDILIPLSIDNFLFDGWKSGRGPRIRERLVADFRSWNSGSKTTEAQLDLLVGALRRQRAGVDDIGDHLDLIATLSQSSRERILLIIIDGLGGLAHEGFQARTELEYAHLPNLDTFVQRSNTDTGLVYPVGRGFVPGCTAGELALFGYDLFASRVKPDVVTRSLLSGGRSFGKLFSVRPVVISLSARFRTIAELVGISALGAQARSLDDEFDILCRDTGEYDFVCLHYEEPNNFGLSGGFLEKVRSLEMFDRVFPRVFENESFSVIAITGDHSTSSLLRRHTHHSVPLAIMSVGHQSYDETRAFTEAQCSRGQLGRLRGPELMPFLMAQAGKLRRLS